MEEVESYDLNLSIKQLKLAVKFPCRLTLQHAGKHISPEIQSNGTNFFVVNRDVSIKQEKQKEHLQININLATDKGGNIMAGIVKINMNDIASSQGQSFTISLQKCLDPYATISFIVKSVKLNRSRVRRGTAADDRKQKYANDTSKFQTKSQVMVNDPSKNIKQKVKFNEAESFIPKRSTLNSMQPQTASGLKQKAYSMVGYKAANSSFQKDLALRFKHLNKREDQESKTIIVSGNRRETGQAIKASLEANQKQLKLQIIKFKTKFEESQRNLQQKSRQIKNIKDQVSQLNRQLAEKQFLIEENNTKSSHIAKLQQNNKILTRQLNEERSKIIDLQRCLQDQKNSNFMQMSRYKQESQKKQYDFQKNLYEKKQELKEVMQENQYKINQINKMKALIEDLQRSLDTKTYQYQKNYNHEKNQHNKAKINYQQQNTQLLAEISKIQIKNEEISVLFKKSEEQTAKLQKKIEYLEAELLQREVKFDQQCHLRSQLQDEKKNYKKAQEQLNLKLKNLSKDISQKEKDIQEIKNQLNQVSALNKKKVTQLLQKNKAYTAKIQQLQNKTNLLTAQEEKIKRALQMTQKQLKSLQQNQKLTAKTLKVKDDRILQLQKDITDTQAKNNVKDSLAKKQVEYKGIQHQKLTLRVTQLQKGHQKERELAQQRRLQLLKSENKLKIFQQNNSRLHEQIKDLKVLQIKKDDEWSQKVKELNEQIKMMQSKEAEVSKALHSTQIQKINLRNQASKLQKNIQILGEKNDRLRKKEYQLQNFIKTLQSNIQQKNQNLIELENSFKELENQYKTLQADKTKTEKITTIINEEKDLAKNDINKLKKELQKRQQKQDQYINEIKNLKEEITRWELKFNSTTREYQKFKINIQQSIKHSLSVKNSFTSIDTISTSLDYSRGLSKSRYKNNDFSSIEAGELKFGQTIEAIAKESQQIIFQLNDQLKKTKREKELVEKELLGVNARSKQNEEMLARQLKELNAQIQDLSVQHSAESEEYEEKIFSFEKQVKKKQKAYSDLSCEFNELKQIHFNLQTSYEINESQYVAKINSLKHKVIDSERKEENVSQTFIQLEEKISILQSNSSDLAHQNEVLNELLSKKQKQYLQTLELYQELSQEIQNAKRIRSDLSVQVLSLKQNLIVEKESNKQLIAQLKGEEEKNNQLKKFNNEVLKDKEGYIRKEAEKQQKMYFLQEKIQIGLIQISQKTEQIAQKEKYIAQYKEHVRIIQAENAALEASIGELKALLERERQRAKQKQRKVAQKQSELQSLNAQLKKNSVKYESQLAQITEENHNLNSQLLKLKDLSSHRQNQLEYQIKRLTENEKKLNEANVSLEEQIFFEKQMNSINHSKTQDLNLQILELSVELDRHKNTISSLNDQVKEKEESLFALSGKLYLIDNKLQSKEEEIRSRVQKAELQWRYKIQQICQEYQNKIQIMQKQRNYMNNGIEGFNENILKLQNEKKVLISQLQKQKQSWESKLKKVQEQKLASLVQKNKQIQKFREMFQELEEKLKRRDFQYKSLEEDKRKIEEKLKELRVEIQKSEDKKGQIIRNLQKEIDQLKRKQGQLKRFKDALKNNQWATERQIKKNIQLSAKGLASFASQQHKDEVMNLMRNLETSITRIALPNIDEL